MRHVAAFALSACAALLASACSSTPPAQATRAVRAITFEAGACYGFCPDFTATIEADGRGSYHGRGFVKARGEHKFAAEPERFDALRKRLAPFRPDRSVAYDGDHCDGPVATDNPSVKVTWRDADGTSTTLDWYMGCRQPGLADRSDALYHAWQEVPAIAALVGPDEERDGYDAS